MTTCSIKWCGKNTRLSSYKKDGLTFHRFPKEEERRVQWAKACARGPNWRTPRKALICSRHFEKKFFSIKNRVRLTSDAVPTLLIPRVEIESDMENYVKYKLVGGRLKLKEGTVPHKFQCQQEKTYKRSAGRKWINTATSKKTKKVMKEELPEYEDSVEEMTEGDTETEGEEEESDSNASETLGTMRPKVDDMTA